VFRIKKKEIFFYYFVRPGQFSKSFEDGLGKLSIQIFQLVPVVGLDFPPFFDVLVDLDDKVPHRPLLFFFDIVIIQNLNLFLFFFF